ncbi:MAG: YebC/PmpR family DNA-binding transcriptional regulator [Oligoflexia bacterium]|nr:YebC/PmpR family DNA-binding transcriptional regulator [Oligoflexia bacterium]
MGAQWKHAGRQANAAKRGAMISKLAKEIQIAAKQGGADPGGNSRLRTALEAARRQSVPRDVIERAVKKGAGLLEGASYELVTYEGFAPHKVPVIVECMTDNKNRTASDIRILFRKGQLGSSGSVGYLFDRMGVIEAAHSDRSIDIEGAAIEAGAQNVEKMEDSVDENGKPQIGARFFTETTDLDAVNKALIEAGWATSAAEMRYIPKSLITLGDAESKDVIAFLEDIDDNDDVHRVYPALA